MSLLQMLKESLVHLAALATLAGFFFREQLVLRGLFILGTLLYIAFYMFVPPSPLWNAIVWNVLLVAVNIVVLGFILIDRKAVQMTPREQTLALSLGTMSPGQFRRLVKRADWKSASDTCVLTSEGEPVTSLYFVFSGKVRITKGGKTRTRSGNMFVGEIAFLRRGRASATVELERGTNYVEWSSGPLRKLLDKDESMKTTMLTVLSRDLADKVALS